MRDCYFYAIATTDAERKEAARAWDEARKSAWAILDDPRVGNDNDVYATADDAPWRQPPPPLTPLSCTALWEKACETAWAIRGRRRRGHAEAWRGAKGAESK